MFNRPQILAVSLFILVITIVSAWSEDDFYKGKTINLVIGYEPGGGYDLYGRLVARYLGRYIPGHPDVVPQNMPGAGGIRAANFMYNVAPRDGTELGLVTQTVALEKMLESHNVQYEASRFNWVGRIEPDDDVLITWHTSKVKTIEDAFKYTAVVPSPSTGIFMPPVLDNVLGTKFKIITGYLGSNDAIMAMQRGEADGATTSWAALKTSKSDWLSTGIIHLIVQFSPTRNPELPSVPDMVEIARTFEQRRVLSLFANGAAVGKAIFAPEDVSASQVEVLRAAFDQVMKDPKFLAEAQRLHLAIAPMEGAELQSEVENITHAPETVREAAVRARAQP